MMCKINFDEDLQFDEMNEEELIRASAPPTKFTNYVQVKFDEKTGGMIGWDTLFKMLEQETVAKAKGLVPDMERAGK